MKNPEETLDYKETERKLTEYLEDKNNAIMVLSTSSDDIVMSRCILTINDGLDIYCFTWKYARKCAQIEKNSRVSLCRDKVEIEGKAKILGSMTDMKNKSVLEKIKNKHPEAVKKWMSKPNMVIMKIEPVFACVDGYLVGEDSYLEYIDFENKNAYKVKWANY